MNRILQKFVGSDTSSSSSTAAQRRTGSSAPTSGGWASSHAQNGGVHAQSYPYANEQQQHYYGQQQQQQPPPSNTSSSNGYYPQQQHGYVATNSQGQCLDEIPLSSPVASAKSNASAFFDDAPYAQQQQQQYASHFGYSDQQQQQYTDAYSQQQHQQQQHNHHQHAPSADSFFQPHSDVATAFESPAQPSSAALFAQSTTSSFSSSSAHHLFDSVAADDDPFASAPTSTTTASAFSFSGVEQTQQQQPPLSTTGSVSDLFATAPLSSPASSFDGFSQHSHYHEPTLSTATSASDLFASAPPSSHGFELQQPQSPHAFDTHGDATALSRSPSGAAELFASAPPSAHSASSPFDSVAPQQQDVSGWGTDATPSADLFASSSVADSNSFFGGARASDPAGEVTLAPPVAATESVSDLFAQPSQAATSAFGTSEQFASESPAATATTTILFAPSTRKVGTTAFSTDQQHDQQLQEQYDQQQQQQQYDEQYHAYQFQHQQQYDEQYSEYQYQHQQQVQDQYQGEYQGKYQQHEQFSSSSNPETATATALFSSGDAHSAVSHGDPFATTPSATSFPSDVSDPFAQSQHSADGHAHAATNGFAHTDTTSDTTNADVGATQLSPFATADRSSPSRTSDVFAAAAPASAASLFNSVAAVSSSSSSSPARDDLTTSASLSSPLRHEPIAEPPAIASPRAAAPLKVSTSKCDVDPAADNDDSERDAVDAIAHKLQNTTLDDSTKLAAMYKHMAERLEGEKRELLKVLADQADQFYQMQEYIASLEHEVETYRSGASRTQ